MQQSPRAVALRATGVLLIALGLVLAGILVDWLTGLGPVGTLIPMVIGVIFGTIMILVIVTSSFPRPPDRLDSDATDGDKQGSR